MANQITDKLQYTGQGYLDDKLNPVNYYATVPEGEEGTVLTGTNRAIPTSGRKEGMECIVLTDETNGGKLTKYRLVGGRSDKYWKRVIDSQEDIDTEIIDKLSTASIDCGTF